jgi:anti-sigma regulatory factor (Ser/Thr protein kinase)
MITITTVATTAVAKIPAHFETVFDGVAASVPAARHWVRDVLGFFPGLPADLVADALTCVSELATNAVTHTVSGQGGGRFTACVEVGDRHVTVEVIDQGAATTPEATCGNGTDEHGRGLFIAAQLGTVHDGPAPDGPGRRVGVTLRRVGVSLRRQPARHSGPQTPAHSREVR